MADKSSIEWTDATWNPMTGCTQVSPGCDHCYAKTLIDTRQSKNPTSVRFGHPFEEVMLHPERLEQPLKWTRPRRIFVNSLSDLFHRDVPDSFIRGVFYTMAEATQHSFQVLTKRPERMRRFMRDFYAGMTPAAVLPNVWLGVSIESMDYEWRVKMLRETPAAVRWISAEPLLGSLGDLDLAGLDWVVVGGESGAGARPMDAAWARELRVKCITSGVPYLFKQWGSHDEHGRPMDKHAAGRLLDGRTWDEYPA